MSEAPGCGERVFSLAGGLADVTADGAPTAGGTGAYALRLTLRRAAVFGRCVTYARIVQGTFDLG